MARKANSKNTMGYTPTQEQDLYDSILPKKKHEPGGPITLVIDGMNFAHTTYHSYSRLSYKGKSVAMLFGIPQMLRTLIVQYRPERVIVVWDGFKSKRRMKWCPTYKTHRDKEKRARMESQILKVRKLLYYMGIPQVHNEKVEGDDMIYLIAQRESLLRRVIIVSGDKDFLQLVNFDISVYNIRNKSMSCTFAFQCNEMGIVIPQVVDYISLIGDSSDDIPGIRGIGPAKAKAFLQKYKSWKLYMEDEDALFPGLMDKDKANKTMKVNRKMIDLKWYCYKFHTKPKWITYYRDKGFPKFNTEKYEFLCRRYNLKTMLTETFKKSFQEL